jgi:hypothetical protein
LQRRVGEEGFYDGTQGLVVGKMLGHGKRPDTS